MVECWPNDLTFSLAHAASISWTLFFTRIVLFQRSGCSSDA